METEPENVERIEVDFERMAHLVENIESDLRTLKQMLSLNNFLATQPPAYYQAGAALEGEEQSIEGIFDGERMLDYQGKSYQVSANYASKSKLVEGDPLKLYITRDGKFFYKQLGPVPRKTIPGVLRAEGNHYVVDGEDGVVYSVLTASVTYYMSLYNARPGDNVMIMIPADQPAHWAVIDNLL